MTDAIWTDTQEMKMTKADREANQVNELNTNIFNSVLACSQFVILTQQATFWPPLQQKLNTQRIFTHLISETEKFKAYYIRCQEKASFSAPSQGHLCSRFPGEFNNALSHWLSTFINNNNSSFNLKSTTKWSIAVRSTVYMVALLTRNTT